MYNALCMISRWYWSVFLVTNNHFLLLSVCSENLAFSLLCQVSKMKIWCVSLRYNMIRPPSYLILSKLAFIYVYYVYSV